MVNCCKALVMHNQEVVIGICTRELVNIQVPLPPQNWSVGLSISIAKGAYGLLLNEVGALIMEDIEKAELLNVFFA